MLKLGKKAEAIDVWTRGWAVADERGDKMPRDEMARMLDGAGRAPVPAARSRRRHDGPGTGVPLPAAGLPGRRAGPASCPRRRCPTTSASASTTTICADCWNDWLRNYSIKVINELRLDLSSEYGQEEYDKYMREFFGFEWPPKP